MLGYHCHLDSPQLCAIREGRVLIHCTGPRFCAEYGTSHGLGVLGDSIRTCECHNCACISFNFKLVWGSFPVQHFEPKVYRSSLPPFALVGDPVYIARAASSSLSAHILYQPMAIFMFVFNEPEMGI